MPKNFANPLTTTLVDIEMDNLGVYETWYIRGGRYHSPGISASSTKSTVSTPAFRSYHPNGQLRHEEYYHQGDPDDPSHHIPARRSYHPNGQLESESWFDDGKLRSPNPHTPAKIKRLPNGEIISQSPIV